MENQFDAIKKDIPTINNGPKKVITINDLLRTFAINSLLIIKDNTLIIID